MHTVSAGVILVRVRVLLCVQRRWTWDLDACAVLLMHYCLFSLLVLTYGYVAAAHTDPVVYMMVNMALVSWLSAAITTIGYLFISTAD